MSTSSFFNVFIEVQSRLQELGRGAEAATQPDAQQQPERATHERERKLPHTPDAHVRGRQAATRTTKESNVPLTQPPRRVPQPSA